MIDPWAEMDAWCKDRAWRVGTQGYDLLEGGEPLDSPAYRRLLGQSDAYHAMRSFIHGARNCDSGRLPKGEDSRSEAECEASQSGLSDSEGIAQTPPPRKSA